MKYPDFIAQTAEPMSDEDARRWYSDRTQYFKDAGCKTFRASAHPSYSNFRLLEGWEEDISPHQFEKLPEPFWFLRPTEERKG